MSHGALPPLNEPELPMPLDEPELPTPLDEPELPTPLDEPELPTPLDEPELPTPLDEPELPTPLDEPELPERPEPLGVPLLPVPFPAPELLAEAPLLLPEVALEPLALLCELPADASPESGAENDPHATAMAQSVSVACASTTERIFFIATSPVASWLDIGRVMS